MLCVWAKSRTHITYWRGSEWYCLIKKQEVNSVQSTLPSEAFLQIKGFIRAGCGQWLPCIQTTVPTESRVRTFLSPREELAMVPGSSSFVGAAPYHRECRPHLTHWSPTQTSKKKKSQKTHCNNSIHTFTSRSSSLPFLNFLITLIC